MKILNLYACLGGNRYKWDEVDDIEVTAIDNDPECVRLYKERFPNDNVLLKDAHQYLLDHYKEFDFIWSSPPCPTHSRLAMSRKNKVNYQNKFPDLRLYEEIIFLSNFFEGKFCIENVIPYYDPLIPGKKRGRHIYWTNFYLPNILTNRNVLVGSGKNELKNLSNFHNYDFNKYKGGQSKLKIARNLVDYVAGKTILKSMKGIWEKENPKQMELFN